MTENKLSEKRTHKVRTPFNYQPEKGAKNRGISLTVPDQSIPLRVLLDRHTRGIPLGVAERTPMFEGEDNVPVAEFGGINPATLDLADLEELRKANAEKLFGLNKDLEDAKKRKKAEAEQKRLDDLVAARLKESGGKTTDPTTDN